MTLRIAFYGAAGSVTGSKYLLTIDDHRVLVDCGMFQGEKPLRLMNWQSTPFPPQSLDAVLITHAHVDHTGWLPRLVKEGYRGHIYMTPATAEMSRILLMDAARLQEEDAEYANRKGFSRHHPALPLYTEKDVHRTMGQVRIVNFRQPLQLQGGATVTFRNAGHILGSASIEVRTAGGKTIVFSGDLGRFSAPLHSDPDPRPDCDVLVLESTYGDRDHGDVSMEDELRAALLPAIARKATILIPAFAVARAQLVGVILRELMGSGRIPEVPIHIDSPMASDVTGLYGRYRSSESLDAHIPFAGARSLFPANVRFHRTVQESKQLNELPGPRIIISSSGMLAGGRVLHHLRRLGPIANNLVLLVGYQATGTRGRDLVEGRREIRIHGQTIHIAAQVLNLHGFSAHADRNELLRWVESGTEAPRIICLTHGDAEARTALQAELERRSPAQVLSPALGEEYDLERLLAAKHSAPA